MKDSLGAAIDQGTTSGRALIFDHGGAVRVNEFVIRLQDAGEPRHIGRFGAKIREVVREPIQFGRYRLGASIGVAVFPDHAEDGERLLGCPVGLDQEVQPMTQTGRWMIGFHAGFRPLVLAAARS